MATHKRKIPPDESLLLRIEVAMHRKGMNQKQLGDAVGAGQSAVSQWFRRRGEPEKWRLPRLATVLGVSIDWLMGNPLESDQDFDLERYLLEIVKTGGAPLFDAFEQLSPEEVVEAIKNIAKSKSSAD